MKLRIISGELIVEVIDGDFAKPGTVEKIRFTEPEKEPKKRDDDDGFDLRNIDKSLDLDGKVNVAVAQRKLAKIYYPLPNEKPTSEEKHGQSFMPRLNEKPRMPI